MRYLSAAETVICTAVPAVAQVLSVEGGFGMHPYRLWMAVAPTKNIDRFEWFTEKAVEMGVDRITPLLCAHSERRVFNRDRGQRIVVSAAKQSLKGVVPQLDGLTSFKDMMAEIPDFAGRKFIAYCDSDIASGLNTRKSISPRKRLPRLLPQVSSRCP